MRKAASTVASLAMVSLLVGSPAVASGEPGQVAHAVPRCTISTLKVHVGTILGAGGNEGLPIQLRNVSKHECSLEGYPGLLRLTKNKHRVQTKVHRGSSYILKDPGPALVRLKPGQVASFGAGFVTEDTTAKCPPSRLLEVTPPNAYKHHTVRTPQVLACHGGAIYVTAVEKGKRVGTAK